jgi:hypothetical protein
VLNALQVGVVVAEVLNIVICCNIKAAGVVKEILVRMVVAAPLLIDVDVAVI